MIAKIIKSIAFSYNWVNALKSASNHCFDESLGYLSKCDKYGKHWNCSLLKGYCFFSLEDYESSAKYFNEGIESASSLKRLSKNEKNYISLYVYGFHKKLVKHGQRIDTFKKGYIKINFDEVPDRIKSNFPIQIEQMKKRP